MGVSSALRLICFIVWYVSHIWRNWCWPVLLRWPVTRLKVCEILSFWQNKNVNQTCREIIWPVVKWGPGQDSIKEVGSFHCFVRRLLYDGRGLMDSLSMTDKVYSTIVFSCTSGGIYSEKPRYINVHVGFRIYLTVDMFLTKKMIAIINHIVK